MIKDVFPALGNVRLFGQQASLSVRGYNQNEKVEEAEW
jgi:hypothetical protein